jgi:16S rRNA (uracil1498-N3)-methyltransferase
MAAPFFYISKYEPGQKELTLEEDTSRHVIQVLRMKVGDKLNLTDGKGNLLTCSISDDNKKHCGVTVEETRYKEQGTRRISIAISLLKNANRFEWFLEKATEIGVNEIFPLLCERTEKEKFRYDRMNAICISAMLQSQQCWLPLLHEPIPFNDLAKRRSDSTKKFIAHCEDSKKNPLHNYQIDKLSDCLIVIGPEGDFTASEIELALLNNFIPVSLGDTRLRTETAGIVAATLLVNRS